MIFLYIVFFLWFNVFLIINFNICGLVVKVWDNFFNFILWFLFIIFYVKFFWIWVLIVLMFFFDSVIVKLIICFIFGVFL